MAIFLGLLSALLWGIADLLGRFAGRAIGPYRALFYVEVIGVVGLLLWFAMFPNDAPWESAERAPLSTWALVAAAGVAHILGAFAITQALIIGPIALVMPIVTSYGAISAVLAITTGEALPAVCLIGIAITVVGTVLASIPGNGGRERSMGGVPWALGAALGYGLSFWAQGHFLVAQFGGLGSSWLFFAFGVTSMVLLAGATRRISIILLPPPSAMAVTFGGGVLAIGGYVCIALGFATGHVAIVAVLSTLSSVVTAILGYAVLGERLSRHQWAGAAFIIGGVALINAA